MMDSRSRRLPFCLSGSRSSYTSSSPTVSSSSSSSSALGSSRLYGRDSVLSSDRFPRASSTSSYKTELEQQNSRLLSSSRDYSGADPRSSSWKLPTSLTSSSRAYDRPWAESTLSSRSKLTDPEGRLGMRSGLLNLTDDGDTKRAKLSYGNRGLYTRTPNTTVTGTSYSSSGLSSGRGLSEKQNDFDSSWTSCRLLSRSSSSSSSKPLLTRREQETKTEPSLSGLGDRRIRTPGLTSSLYPTDRVTSTYAQGARPKETYSSSSSSPMSAARENPLSRHLSSSSSSSSSHRSSPLVHDFSSSRTSTRYGSAALHSSQEPTKRPDATTSSSSSSSSSYSSYIPWYSSSSSSSPSSAPQLRRQQTTTTPATLPPRPAPEGGGGEAEGRRSTRRLLSRLFSRRSSQDSSSGSSSVRSLDDDSPPSTGGESVDSDGPDAEDPTTLGNLRSRRADLAPIQENNVGYRSGPPRPRMASWREPGVGSSSSSSSSTTAAGNSSSSSSWLSSSLRGRCPPLLARLRRHRDNENPRSAADEGFGRPQHLLRRWDNLEHNKASQDDEDEDDDDEDEEDDDDEEEEEVGAVGLESFTAAHPCRLDDDALPELEDASLEFSSPRRRTALYENISVSRSSLSSGGGVELDEQREKTASSRDQEKLRKIKERLLMEDSDEEEGDLCRICQMGEESPSNPLIQPCRCTGSLQYVHQECIKRWLRSKIGSGTNLEAITTCELCKEKLRLNIDNFDIQELYRTHVQSEYDEFISSGLYLVVLLHFCEQRFSDVLGAVDAAGLFNLVRILHEHMDNLESPRGESDEETRDNRPSIEFSDLDDDLEEEY